MKIGCVILAAGKSSRFGGNKLLEDLKDECVLSRTLKAIPLESFDGCVAVCADAAVAECIRGCGLSPLCYAGGCLSDSIRNGIDALPAMDAWMFVNGDQPLLKRESVLKMLSACRHDPFAVYRLSFDAVQASPVIIPAALKNALLTLRGEKGGMAAVRGSEWKVIPVQAESANELWDVDDRVMFEQVKACLP